MIDDDDDLFAPRPAKAAPAPAPLPPRRTRRIPAGFVGPRWPCASLACDCGAREEVKEPCPDRLDCWGCRGLETMRRHAPRYLPPVEAGRALTDHERRGMQLDGITR